MNATDLARNTGSQEQGPDQGPLAGAFARYQDELLGTLFYLLGNVEDARDALQESFVKCWRHRQQAAQVGNLKAWIFRVTVNTGKDFRQSAWRRRSRAMMRDEVMIESQEIGPAAQLEHSEQLERIRTALKALRSEEQEVFLLRQNGQLSYEEIATTLGIPIGTVKTRMRLALARLRAALL